MLFMLFFGAHPACAKPPHMDLSVSQVLVYDSQSGSTVMTLSDGAVLDKDQLSTGLVLRAQVGQDVSSVAFALNSSSSTDNQAPFEASLPQTAGSYSLSVTGYGKTDTRGPSGDTLVIRFTIKSQSNASPSASADSFITQQDTSITFEPLTNDTDPDGDPLKLSAIAVAPTQGTASISTDGQRITYTPNSGFYGSDSLTYEVSDGNGGSDQALVTLTIEQVIVLPNMFVTDASVTEGGQATVRVSLDKLAESDVTFDYQTQDSTAISGEDYNAASGQGVIATGSSFTDISLTTIDDTLDEADLEQFHVLLSNVQNATLVDDAAVIGIQDNDVTPDPNPNPDAAKPSDFMMATPDPLPALPAGFDIFQPPLQGSKLNDLAIAEHIRTAGPNQSLAMTGIGFVAGQTKLQFFSQTNSSDAAQTSVEPLGIESNSLTVRVPSGIPSWSMYLLWPDTSGQVGMPVAINKAEGWWTSPQEATAGGTIALMGRNLARNNGTTNSYIYIKPAGTATSGVWANVSSVNPYRIEFTVPALAPGQYEAWVHNGHGGHFGWSEPVTFDVIAENYWAGQDSRIFNVKDYGAQGDGVSDDTNAINSAVSAASRAAPATVYLPAGEYVLSSRMQMSSNLRFMGDGRDLTTVRTSSSFSDLGLIYSNEENIHITGMTLKGTGSLGEVLRMRGSRNVLFTQTRIDGADQKCFDFHAAVNVTLRDNEIIGRAGFIGTAKYVTFDRNLFLAAYDANELVTCWGCDQLALTNNVVRDLDPTSTTGQGKGRFLVTQGHWGPSEHIYIAGNETIDFMPRPEGVDQNSGEQILFENGGAWATQKPASATANTITLTVDPGDLAGNEIVVVNGRGVGQHRRVISYDSTTLTAHVSPDFRVVPDSTSTITASPIVSKAAIYKNIFDGKSDYADRYTAAAGIQTYGSGFEIIGDSNKMNNLRDGISVWSLTRSPGETAPGGFNLMVNNEITNSQTGIMHISSQGDNARDVYALTANVYRGNRMDNLTNAAFAFETGDSYVGAHNFSNIIEYNQATNVQDGFVSPDSNNRVEQNVLINNSFDRGSATFSGSTGIYIGTEQIWIRSDNTATGFESGNTP